MRNARRAENGAWIRCVRWRRSFGREAHGAHFFENRAVTSRFENPVVKPRPFEDLESAESPLESVRPVGLFYERVVYKAEAIFGTFENHRIAFDDARIVHSCGRAFSIRRGRIII
jgi:hypothetical protein